MASQSYQKLQRLHKQRNIELWLSKKLGHPRYNQFLLTLGARRPDPVYKTVWDLLRWFFEAAVLIYLFFFSTMQWWLGLIWLLVVVWYEMRKSRYDLEKLVLESALSDERVFEALWHEGLAGIHRCSENKTYMKDMSLNFDWREIIDGLHN